MTTRVNPTVRKRRAVVKHRNRYDAKWFFPDGSSLRWTSTPDRALTAQEMLDGLREIISTLEALAALDFVPPATQREGIER